MSLLPTWHSLSPAIEILAPEISGPAGADQLPGCFLTPFWEKSAESSGGLVLDSALSSLACSPVSPPNTSTDGFFIRELIGKLGNSAELSPQSSKSGHLYEESDVTVRHSTSPMHPGFPNLSPAAATRLSSHAARSFDGCSGQLAELAAMGKVMSRVSSSPVLKPVGSLISNQASQDRAESSNSPKESSVSDPERDPGPENWRKRKAATKGKDAGVEGGLGLKRAKRSHGGSGNGSGHAKASEEARGGEGDGEDEKLQVKKPPEPPRDYIHVRARRGQATDSHSLAERVRREKISERMKILQDLVPGCNKVTGKAVMLDKIISYVQSLQRQVEFLSMKLASFTAGTDIDMNSPTAKDVLQSESIVPSPSQMLPLGSFSSLAVLYGPKATTRQYSMDPSNNEQFLPYQAFLGDDLHSIVQMGFGQN